VQPPARAQARAQVLVVVADGSPREVVEEAEGQAMSIILISFELEH
jgi:hypothetical protein